MEAKCIHCGEEVKDWEPRYCCNGQDCGCYGQPIDPPEHEVCVAIFMLNRLKEISENKVNISGCTKFGKDGVSTELLSGRKVISNDSITKEELNHIMDLSGIVNSMASWVDFITDKLKGVEK